MIRTIYTIRKALILCTFLLSSHAIHAKVDMKKKAQECAKKTCRVAWHAGQTAVGTILSYITLRHGIIETFKNKTLFRLNDEKLLSAGMGTAGVTCLHSGVSGLEHELKLRRFLKKICKKRARN